MRHTLHTRLAAERLSETTIMKTGNIVFEDSTNDHLDDTYIEVYPNGDVCDLSVTTRIPKEHKSYSKRVVQSGPSPLLVRKSYWDANHAAVV